MKLLELPAALVEIQELVKNGREGKLVYLYFTRPKNKEKRQKKRCGSSHNPALSLEDPIEAVSSKKPKIDVHQKLQDRLEQDLKEMTSQGSSFPPKLSEDECFGYYNNTIDKLYSLNSTPTRTCAVCSLSAPCASRPKLLIGGKSFVMSCNQY